MKRRLVFAAPFVVVTASCERPVEHHHHHEYARVHVDASVDATPEPRELVDALPPLVHPPEEDLCDGNFHKQVVYCNPPPRGWRPPPPDEVKVSMAAVSAMVRDGTGARVRFVASDSRTDKDWTAEFVSETGEEVGDGACEIVDHEGSDVDCVTAREPEQLVTSDGHTLRIKVTPPTSLVLKIKYTRENWNPQPYDPDRGRTHPDPTESPAKPVYARIVKVSTLDDETLLSVAAGSETGPTKKWSAELVDNKDHPIENGRCIVVRVTRQELVCRTKLSTNSIKSDMRVLVSPPDHWQ